MFHRAPLTGAPVSFALLAMIMMFVVFDSSPAQAQTEGNRAEFEVTIDDRHAGDGDGDLRSRQTAKIAEEVVRRIGKRLDAAGVKSHDVDFDDDRNITVTAYGNHSTPIIKGAVIPSGHLEVRPVLVNDSPWMSLSSELPEDVELKGEPGIFRTDRLYLFAHSASLLDQTLSNYAPEGMDFEIFPHDDGWRSLRLGPTAATESEVQKARLASNPTGLPYVSISLSARAAQSIRSIASAEQVRYLAIILDGEVVALQSFSERNFSETLIVDPPAHLQSTEARDQWATQVAGRLATPIPVQLVETQE